MNEISDYPNEINLTYFNAKYLKTDYKRSMVAIFFLQINIDGKRLCVSKLSSTPF